MCNKHVEYCQMGSFWTDCLEGLYVGVGSVCLVEEILDVCQNLGVLFSRCQVGSIAG
jgi:hypothetical protein